MMRWQKRGRILVPDGTIPWMKSHASIPVPDSLDDVTLRIHFAAATSRIARGSDGSTWARTIRGQCST
jgi:hypothetical protein